MFCNPEVRDSSSEVTFKLVEFLLIVGLNNTQPQVYMEKHFRWHGAYPRDFCRVLRL